MKMVTDRLKLQIGNALAEVSMEDRSEVLGWICTTKPEASEVVEYLKFKEATAKVSDAIDLLDNLHVEGRPAYKPLEDAYWAVLSESNARMHAVLRFAWRVVHEEL